MLPSEIEKFEEKTADNQNGEQVLCYRRKIIQL